MGRSISWLCKNREEIDTYVVGKSAAVALDDPWWVLAVAIKKLMIRVDECLKCIQEKDKLNC